MSTQFDTLDEAIALDGAGVDRAHAQAQAIVRTINNSRDELATKDDIAGVHSRIRILQWVVGVQSALTLAIFAIVAAPLL